MRHPDFKSYYFKDTEHWRSGASCNLDVTSLDGLRVLPGLHAETITGTGPEDQTPAIDYDPCNHLYWFRNQTRELLRLQYFGPQVVGTIQAADMTKKMVVGAQRLWLLTTKEIQSYALKGLHPLRQLSSDRNILDIAKDGLDGIWWLEGGDEKKAVLYHINRYGTEASTAIALPMPIQNAAISVSRCGGKIILLDLKPKIIHENTEPCQSDTADWRLIIINCSDKELTIIDDIGLIDNGFRPDHLVIDADQHAYLMDSQSAQILAVNFKGELLGRFRPQLPEGSLPISGIGIGQIIAVSTRAGIVSLNFSEKTGHNDQENIATFITPTLISPDGIPRGWQRADIEAVLPEGTTLKISYAATNDESLAENINELLKNQRHTSAYKMQQLNQHLPWQEDEEEIFAGSDTKVGVTRLHYPLHQVDQIYLWLRLSFYIPPGRSTPSIESLSILYPNRSYLRYLPAVYQENSASTAVFRSYLAIFETLFGDLDAKIDQLPSQIDPETAPPHWLPFLLSLLGLPNPSGLSIATQRILLIEAPKLLAERGMFGALQHLLFILTNDYDEVMFRIEDSALTPLPWILQVQQRRGVEQRLGYDTMLAVRESPMCLGYSRIGMKNGVSLGVSYPNPDRQLSRHVSKIRLRFSNAENVREQLEPIIRIFLPYFVPAHCQVSFEFEPSLPESWQQRQLDVDLRLMDGDEFWLGLDTIAGRFRLPESPTDELFLDQSARLDSGMTLN